MDIAAKRTQTRGELSSPVWQMAILRSVIQNLYDVLLQVLQVERASGLAPSGRKEIGAAGEVGLLLFPLAAQSRASASFPLGGTRPRREGVVCLLQLCQRFVRVAAV